MVLVDFKLKLEKGNSIGFKFRNKYKGLRGKLLALSPFYFKKQSLLIKKGYNRLKGSLFL